MGGGGRTIRADAALEVCNLCQRGVLPAGAEEVAQGAAVDAAVAALVEELEGFAVVGRGLVAVIHSVRRAFKSLVRSSGVDVRLRVIEG